MLTVLDSIKLSEEYLQKKEIEAPRINAELLLADILSCKRLDLYLKFDQPLKQNEIQKYREYISRRGKGEPLQYIIEKVEFYGMNLRVNSSVLIPRPETEILVETIIEENKDNANLNILDIGCGSGNISIALAKNLNNAKIFAIDISEEALLLAKENAKELDVLDLIQFFRGDIFHNNLKEISSNFDLIVSNPPYVSKQDFKNLQTEIKEYEPDIAVTDFADGLKYYRKISEIGSDLLKHGGKIYFEIAMGQSEDVKNILKKNNFKNILSKKDYSGVERIILGERL